jgi:hypothetical protein
MCSMIIAGNASEIIWGEGNWIFLDIGFSGRRKTCGLLVGGGEPQLATFSAATQMIVKTIAASRSTINMVIEAPLSICFRNGNPTGRSIEKQTGSATRFWYVGAGCAVMVASMYLIRQISDAKPFVPVRLFEGFISYKDRSAKSDDRRDTLLLREVVQNHDKFSECIIGADNLKLNRDDVLWSAFGVIGLDCGVPTVIRRSA